MAHKDAKDLKIYDQFIMAGNHITVLDIYEVDDEAMMRIAFHMTRVSSPRRCYMTLPKDALFHTL